MSLEVEKLEVKGKACPMPILLVKRKLESVQSGQILEVIGDCGPAFDSVQNWVKRQGHEVVEASKSGTEFTIKIKKH
jgi:tRNA 2-thiouridine synthesizing protein A